MSRLFACSMMLLAWLGCLAPEVRAANPLPTSPAPHYIRDDAKWLGPGAFQSLDEKLKNFERETSSQIVVAIFPNIPEGEELFDFSQRLYESWKPGQKGQDNGAIFLVFAADRKMRIHTGFGMEGVLPDARCKQIIEDVVAPQLREGNREAAINAGVDAMIAAAKGEYQGTGRTRLDGQEQPGGGPVLIFILLVFGFIILRLISSGALTVGDVIFTILGASRGSGGGWSSGGGGGGGFSGGGGSSGGGGASGGW